MARHLLTVLLLTFALAVNAQTGNTIADNIIRQLSIFRQEKTYVHTDAADYDAGDRIWMKVYVVDALSHEPQSESLYAYVELFAPDGSLARMVKLMNDEGVFEGYIDIPQSAKDGKYILRSYTELSRNADGFQDIKPVYVGNCNEAKRRGKKKHHDDDRDMAHKLKIERTSQGVVVSVAEPADSLLLLAHCRAYPFFIGRIAADSPVVVSNDSLPQGMISLLLIDSKMNVADERLIYSDNAAEQCPLEIAADKAEYRPKEEMTLRLSIPGLHENEKADVSVSVVSTAAMPRHAVSNITQHLFFSSDLAGSILHPERFLKDDVARDSLLERRKWQRYDFGRILKGAMASPVHDAETSQTIEGKVRTYFRKKPVADAKVSLISPQESILAATETDSEGRFSFPFMDYPEGTKYVLRAVDSKDKENVELIIDEKNVEPLNIDMISDYAYMPETKENSNRQLAGNSRKIVREQIDNDAIMLNTVDVSGTRRNSATKGNVYAQLADFSFGLQKIEEIGATCLHELLRHIPGVYLRDNKCYVRAASSIYGDTPAAIVVDGVIVEGDYDLDIIQMQDVARVDVFKTGSTLIWGSAGGAGVISITTKIGTYGDVSTEYLNQKKIMPLGYQKHSDFYSLPGMRKTLYWNPRIVSDVVSLNASDSEGTCLVVVEGVTTEGRLIHEELEIIVR